MTTIYKRIPAVIIAVIGAAVIAFGIGAWQQPVYAASDYTVQIEQPDGYYIELPGQEIELETTLTHAYDGVVSADQEDVTYEWEITNGSKSASIRPNKKDPSKATVKFKDMPEDKGSIPSEEIPSEDEADQGEETPLITPTYWEDVTVSVTVYAEGKAQCSGETDLIVSDDFVRLETEWDYGRTPASLDINEELEGRAWLVHHYLDEEGNPDEELMEGATYECDTDETVNALTVEMNPGETSAAFTVKRTGPEETYLILDAYVDNSGFGLDGISYHLDAIETDLSGYSVRVENPDSPDDWRIFVNEGEDHSIDSKNVTVSNGDFVLNPEKYELAIYKYMGYDETTGDSILEPWEDALKTDPQGSEPNINGEITDGSAIYVIAARAKEGSGYTGETSDFSEYLFLYSRSSLYPYGPDIELNRSYQKFIDEDPWVRYEVKPGTVLTPTVTIDGEELEEGTDYIAEYMNERTGEVLKDFPTAAGTYTMVVRAAEGSSYFGIQDAAVIKVAVPSNFTVKAKNVKAKAKKKTSIKRTKAFKVSGAKGTVTYKKISGNKKITVASNGKITVKKGLKKKKTYSIVVQVTDKGNDAYFAASRTVTVKVKVK